MCVSCVECDACFLYSKHTYAYNICDVCTCSYA